MQALEKYYQNKLFSCEKFDLKIKIVEIEDIHEKDINPPLMIQCTSPRLGHFFTGLR